MKAQFDGKNNGENDDLKIDIVRYRLLGEGSREGSRFNQRQSLHKVRSDSFLPIVVSSIFLHFSVVVRLS